MGTPSQANPAPCKIPLKHRERSSLLALNPTKTILSYPSRAGTQPGHAPGQLGSHEIRYTCNPLISSPQPCGMVLGCQCPSLADTSKLP